MSSNKLFNVTEDWIKEASVNKKQYEKTKNIKEGELIGMLLTLK